MGIFNYDKIKHLVNEEYKIAIETGTFIGIGTELLSKYFEQVYTIEIDYILYNKCKNKFINNKNITCLHGDSKKMLPDLLDDKKIKNENILFWLDAHWSGDDTVDWKNSYWKGYSINTGYSGKKVNGIISGYDQVPLEEEIYQIYENVRSECVIYIDDFNKIDPITLKGFKNKCFQGEDYSHLDFNIIFNYINDRVIFKEITDKYCILKLRNLED